MLRYWWALVLLSPSACHERTKALTDDATRFERGIGVARDYTRALRLYEDRCDQGRGDAVSCRKLALAVLTNRGEPRQPVDVRALLATACQRGDWLACVPSLVPVDPDEAVAACNAGIAAACLAVTWAHPYNQSGTVEAEDHRRLVRACEGDILLACEQLVTNARNAGRVVATGASARVQHACDAGDADACDALGRPIAAATLCRASDFRACAETNDPEALDRACDHRIASACEKVAIAARDADPPDPRVFERFTRACAAGAAICNQNLPEDLAIGCAAYRPMRVPAARRVRLSAPTGTDTEGKAWTAPHGRPFLITGNDDRVPPARYAEVARRLSPAVAVYVMAAPGTEPGPFAPAQLVVLDAASAAAQLAVAGPPDPGSPLERHVGDGWPTVVDASLTPRAVLSLESGLVPATLARCTNGLLAEP